MSQAEQGGKGSVPGFVHRHRFALAWIAVVVFFVWMQWPMLKGTVYRVLKVSPPADGIAWQSDFDAALAEAGRTGKPILLNFTAVWCPPCQVMKHDVWPDAEVREAIAGSYIAVLLDVDAPASSPVAERYNVRAVPTVAIVSGDGKMLRKGGFMSRSAMLEFLKAG